MGDREVDQELVERAQRGDKRAFELLVMKYQRKLARLLSRLVRDPAEVEDVTQEAFIKAYRALPSFRGDSAFYTWLYRIAINTAKNALGAMMTKEDFGIIFGVGTSVYALSFLINGPLVDRIGGKRGIIIAALVYMGVRGVQAISGSGQWTGHIAGSGAAGGSFDKAKSLVTDLVIVTLIAILGFLALRAGPGLIAQGIDAVQHIQTGKP